jgi:GNAT superfamily N-acetyltransferase
MFWRRPRKEFDAGWGKGESRGVGNRDAMASIVAAGRAGAARLRRWHPGRVVLGGTTFVAPRPRGSEGTPRIDDEPVWSIVCFYIARDYQGRGVAEALIRAAIEHASARGRGSSRRTARSRRTATPFTGHERLFEKMGFRVVRPGGRRSTMRYEIAGR